MPDATGALNPTTCALMAAAGLGLLLGYVLRRPARHPRAERRTSRRGEDLLTFLAAGLATAVASTGMWRFFSDRLDLSLELQVPLFAFLEVAMLTSAVRARRNTMEFHAAGVDGVAVWAITTLSAVLSALDARSAAEAFFRLAAPLVAAWLWDRGLAIQRRRQRTARTRVNWRITPERVLVRLGLAEATDRTTGDVDAHRRITRLARAADHQRTLTATGAASWRIRRATRRTKRAMEQAVEHAALAANPARQHALLAQLGSLFNAAALAEVESTAPWDRPRDRPTTAPARDDLSDADLVALGYSAHDVERYLAGMKYRPHPDDITRVLSDGPPPVSPRLTVVPAPPISAANTPPTVPPPGANTPPADTANTTPTGANSAPIAGASTTADLAPTGAKNSTGRRASNRQQRTANNRQPRRPMGEWVALATPILATETTRLGQPPTGEEFATALAKAGHHVSPSTAKNIRAAIANNTANSGAAS